MIRLIRELIRPYRWSLVLILLAMLVETAASLATPWPLKIIIDNVVGHHKMSPWLAHLLGPWMDGKHQLHIAAIAAGAYVVIAILGALASYVDNYYTESVGQYVAHDLRLRTFHHLQRLSLGYYNTHQTGPLLSTITTDIQTIQGFASSSTLSILVDLLTIVCMLALMFWLNWDFTMIAVGVTPFLLLFVSRFKKAVKKATHQVRKEQSDIVAVVQQALEQEELRSVSHATVDAALKARSIKALLSPVVTITVAVCTAVVLWRRAYLILAGVMTVGALTVYLSYLSKFFKPVKDLATTTNAIAQAAVGVDRIRAILDTDTVIPEKSNAVDPPPLRGEVTFEHVAFAYDVRNPVLTDVSFTITPGQLVGIVG